MAQVFIPPQLRDLTRGAARVQAAGPTVREVIAALEIAYPGIAARLCPNGELNPALQVSIDDQMSGRGLRAQVRSDSELHFLPVLGGG